MGIEVLVAALEVTQSDGQRSIYAFLHELRDVSIVVRHLGAGLSMARCHHGRCRRGHCSLSLPAHRTTPMSVPWSTTGHCCGAAVVQVVGHDVIPAVEHGAVGADRLVMSGSSAVAHNTTFSTTRRVLTVASVPRRQCRR